MTGSLQVKNGKYYAVINLYVDGKRKIKWIPTGLDVHNNKKRAEQILRDVIKEYELKSNLVSCDILFCDFVLVWLDNIKSSLDPVTFESYNSIILSHVFPYFSSNKLKLDKIKIEDIQDYINTKSISGKLRGNGGLSPKTIRNHFIILKQTFDYAIKRNLVLMNPCDYVVLPKRQMYKPSFYNINELQDMFKALKDEPLFPLIYVTVLFGLRRSEVLGLKWDSIDFERNLITIKHTVVRQVNVYEKDDTKTKSSYRSYPLTDDVRQMFIDLKIKEKSNRSLFGNEYIDNGYIFKWDNGKMYDPDYVSKKFKKLLKQYGLRDIRFHDLRHSCASLLVDIGFNIKDIQEWLGHADIQTTANIYAHLDVTRKNNIANSLVDSLC